LDNKIFVSIDARCNHENINQTVTYKNALKLYNAYRRTDGRRCQSA